MTLDANEPIGVRVVILKVPDSVVHSNDDYDLDFLEIGDEQKWLQDDDRGHLVSPPLQWDPGDEVVRYLEGVAGDELVVEDVTGRFAPFLTDAPSSMDTPRSTVGLGRLPGEVTRRVVAVWRGWEQWERDKRLPRFSFERLTSDQLASLGWPGTSPYDGGQVVTVRYELSRKEHNSNPLCLLGRMIAHRPVYNEPVVLGEGVSIDCGGFPKKAGTAKAPLLNVRDGTTLEIRDVALARARVAARAGEGRVEIVDDEPAPESLLTYEEAELLEQLRELSAERVDLLFSLLGA